MPHMQAMEAVIMARDWKEQAKRAYDQKFAKARETRQNSDNEGGLIGDHRVGLLPNPH